MERADGAAGPRNHISTASEIASASSNSTPRYLTVLSIFVFDRQSSSVFSVISPTGGIRPPERKRRSLALSLAEREEISRGLSIKESGTLLV